MVFKYLEKEIQLELPIDSIKKRQHNFIHLEYYLIESNQIVDSSLYGKNSVERSYGLEIVKKCNCSLTETKTVENFSCCRNYTKKVLNLLADNTVTPVGLVPILEDLLEY